MISKTVAAPLQLPIDLTIVGIGGCGKRLAMEICNNDWLLKHYSNDGRRLKVYTMDTDANEKVGDEQLNNSLRRKIADLGASGSIESKYYYMPSLANIVEVSDLASREIVEKVKNKRSEPKVTTWWLNDNTEDGITFADLAKIDPFVMDDFGGGVHRRRAISKAIFYKVITEGEGSGFPTFSGRGSVAIIIGLGGGTGSGMFIDLAKYIRSLRGDATQLCLFVVLPTTKEGEKEQLNAAIALTELEYLNLHERLFHNIVVTSLGPTGYKKGEEAKEEVHEFDSMFPNVFVNFFHIERGDINISDAKGPFSSFIFADSHVIEYPIEELKVLKSQYEKIITELELITVSRKELNQYVSAFMERYHSFEEMPPTREDFEYLKKEYKNIENVLMNEIGRLLNYKSMDTVEYFIANQIPAELQMDKIKNFDDLVDYLNKVKTGSMNVKENELTDENDKKLARLIPEALQTLEETARLFKKVSGIIDETVRSALLDILKGNQSVISSISDLNTISKKLNDEIKDLQKNLLVLEGEVQKSTQLKEQTERKVDKKFFDTDKDIDQYCILKRKINSSSEKERELKMKIDRFIAQFKSEEIKAQDKSTWLRESNVSEIQQDIRNLWGETDQSLDGLVSLIDAIAMYYFYDSERKNQEKSGGLIRFIKGDKKKKIRKYEAQKKEKEEYIKTNAKFWNIQINSPFEFYIPEDFVNSGLKKKAEEIKKQILEAFLMDMKRDQVDVDYLISVFDLDRTELRRALREFLTEAYLNKDGYHVRNKEIEGEMKTVHDYISTRTSLSEMMSSVGELHERTFNSRRDLNYHYEKFYAHLKKINEKAKLKNKTQTSLYRTKMGDINPNVLSLIGEMSNLNSLDNDDSGKNELEKLVHQVTATYPSLLENDKLGIHNMMIPISATERWSFGKAGLVVGSTSAYICSSVANSSISSEINIMMALKDAKDAHVITHRHAKPWEITLTFFAATSFIDNISPLTSGGGYWKIYEQRKDNILHHVLKMQEGYYLTRKKLFHLKDAGEIATSERQGENVVSRVEELYEMKKLQEAFK
jgi:hypothetical protein